MAINESKMGCLWVGGRRYGECAHTLRQLVSRQHCQKCTPAKFHRSGSLRVSRIDELQQRHWEIKDKLHSWSAVIGEIE